MLRPYAALYIKLVCMAVTPGGSLFWRQYTRKPTNSLLKTCQQSTWITETMSYGLMKCRLICLVPMASNICGSGQVRSTKVSVSCLIKHGGGNVMVRGCMSAAGVGELHFIEGKVELQHVLWNTATEHDPLSPETRSQGSVPAWQWPQTHLQDDHCFIEEAEGKGDGLAKHVSRLEPNRTSLGILKRKVEVRKVSNIHQLCNVVMEEWKSIPVATCEALVNSMPRGVKAVLDNDGGHTKYWQLTWCMLILTTFPKGCTHFCWQGFSF